MLSFHDGSNQDFCSYLKHGERAKLDRPAIASANMILRGFLYAIEELHLQLSKRIPGSTIGVGGEEKKKRITTSMQAESLDHPEMIHQAHPPKMPANGMSAYQLTSSIFFITPSLISNPGLNRGYQCQALWKQLLIRYAAHHASRLSQ